MLRVWTTGHNPRPPAPADPPVRPLDGSRRWFSEDRDPGGDERRPLHTPEQAPAPRPRPTRCGCSRLPLGRLARDGEGREAVATSFAIGDTVEIPWRPERPVRVDGRMYEAVTRLRSALIVASQRRSTLTYAEASAAIDAIYPARGLARALDLLSYDCGQRKEPSLAALIVRSTQVQSALDSRVMQKPSGSAAISIGAACPDNRAGSSAVTTPSVTV